MTRKLAVIFYQNDNFTIATPDMEGRVMGSIRGCADEKFVRFRDKDKITLVKTNAPRYRLQDG